MPKVMLIGYGNPLRTDDAIGWRAAGELSAQLTGDDVEIVACHQLNPEMAEAVAKFANYGKQPKKARRRKR